MKEKMKKAVILLIWLILWQVTAFFINNPIYFASPLEVVTELANKLVNAAFWQSVGGSLLRILTGFLAAFLLAFISAFTAHRYPLFKDFISPLVTFLKSVPVAAVAVILLIWWGPEYLVLCISLMVVFPNIYLNMQAGIESADSGLIEMADVFGIGVPDRFLWIYRPAYLPHLFSAVSVSLGMGFKSGIAAEVIGLPRFSAGEQLYRDKIYLNTAGVFAWVIVILALSSLTEKLIIKALKLLSDVPPAILKEYSPAPGSEKAKKAASFMTGTGAPGAPGAGPLPGDHTVYAEGIKKAYEGRLIIDTDVKLKPGKIYCLNDPSGAGKSTLFGILTGIIRPDGGRVQTDRISMVFQDDRLVEKANALRNLKFAGCSGDLIGELKKLLPVHVLQLPVSGLSGGERRRLCIIRAMLCPSDIVIMDEPFAGLDEETAERTGEWVLQHLNGRTLLFTTHEAEPASFAGAEVIPLIRS
ncbi:MAG: ATP-binding cassette domain-containing protein [Lachnospiraceae bacterium]|nr:ATP-binding cassette domain-containing protein [Lachnospiraceae bacterium]